MNTIGERIRYARKNKNLTLTELKEKTGLSTGNLSDLENNKSMPSANALIQLKKVLNISIDWILTGEEISLKTNVDTQSINNMNFILSEKGENLLSSYLSLSENRKKDIEGYIKVSLSIDKK